MDDYFSHSIAFLAGTAVGAAGTYLADRFTDQRRAQEQAKSEGSKFEDTRKQMSELFIEMKSDLCQNPTVRNFLVRPAGSTLTSGPDSFVYDEETHPNLVGQCHILENKGYIEDITPGNVPKYRMTEEFVAAIGSMKKGAT